MTVPATAAMTPTTRSARDHDHPKLLAGRPDGGEHAELALAARGDNGEARGGDQGDQQQQDRDGAERAAATARLGAGAPRLPHQRAVECGRGRRRMLAGLASSSTVTALRRARGRGR